MNVTASVSTPATASTRHAWADVARGVGIALVVVGHVLRGLFNSGIVPSTGGWAFVDRFIYAFHMPLFFLLAGVFLGSRAQESFGQMALRRLLRLGYPYVLWASLQMVIQALMSQHTNHPARLGDLWTIVYEPPMQFWFLYVLLLHSLWLGLLDKLGLSRAASLLLALALFLLAPLMPLGPWGMLYQARTFLPYTALGFFLGPARITTSLSGGNARAQGLAMVAVVGFGLVALGAWISERHLALLVALVGSVATLALCGVITQLRSTLSFRLADMLNTWGRASMAIFVAHTMASAATRIILQRALHIDDAFTHVVLGTVIGIVGPLVLWLLSERLRFPYLFEWPERRAR